MSADTLRDQAFRLAFADDADVGFWSQRVTLDSLRDYGPFCKGWYAHATQAAAPSGDAPAELKLPDRLDWMADRQVVGSQAMADLYAAATHLRKTPPYAAQPPQEIEATPPQESGHAQDKQPFWICEECRSVEADECLAAVGSTKCELRVWIDAHAKPPQEIDATANPYYCAVGFCSPEGPHAPGCTQYSEKELADAQEGLALAAAHRAQEIEATPPQVEPAEWISVDERVPPFGTAVLAYLPGWPIGILADGGDEQELRAVTHWMPLPAPPIAAASKPEVK